MSDDGKCPVTRVTHAGRGRSNREWWPNQLNLTVLHQSSSMSDPMAVEKVLPWPFSTSLA